MSLIDALSNPPETTRHWRSQIDVWADTLTEPEREALLAAATNLAWPHSSLRNVIAEAGGPDVSANTVYEWRKKHGWRRDA